MSLYFNEIYDKLKSDFPHIEYTQNIPSFIKDVKFITNNSDLKNINTLYIGKASQLVARISSELNSNFILYNDNNEVVTKLVEANIITVSIEEDIYSIFNEVKDMFLKDMEIANPAAKLLNSLAQGKGLKYLLEIGAESLNNPLILIDASFSVLAYSKNENITDELWNKNIEMGYCTYEFIAAVKQLKSIKDSPFSNEPFIVTCEASNIRRLVSKVIIDSKIVGYLLLLECHDTIKDEHRKIVKILNNAISEEMKNNMFYRNIKGFKYENLLLDLLDGKIYNEEVAIERMKGAECNFGKNLYIITLDISTYNFSTKHKDGLKESIENILINSKSIYYEDNIVILLDMKNELLKNNNLFKEFEKFLSKNKLFVGISNNFSLLTKLKYAYNESKKTLQLSRLLKRRGSVFFYDDFKFYDLISSLDEDLIKFCHPALIKLIEFDKDNNTNYYNTLLCYLSNNQNMNLTSEKLYIHRNTLNYRISKIKEIIYSDLKDSEIIFQISYSYKIMEYLKATSKEP